MELKYSHLIGKNFDLGKQDCFELVRNFYFDNFGIKIRNYARPQMWDADKIDLISSAWEREGFVPVHNWNFRMLRPGDVLVMAIGSMRANHFAVYVGENKIVHHLAHRLSQEETLRDFWSNCTLYVLRHPDVPDLTPQLPVVDIQELINARYRPEAAA